MGGIEIKTLTVRMKSAEGAQAFALHIQPQDRDARVVDETKVQFRASTHIWAEMAIQNAIDRGWGDMNTAIDLAEAYGA